VKLQDISIKETQVKTLTLIHSDDLVSFTVDSFQSDEKWVQMVFIVLGVEVGRQQLEFMDTVARQLIHLQLMSEILSQSL
jgi:hypothetical protein